MNGYGRDRWNYRGGPGPATDTVDHPQGVAQRLQQPFYNQITKTAGAGTMQVITALAGGAFIFKNVELGFNMRSFVIDNPTQYVLLHLETLTQIPAGFLGFVVPVQPPTPHLNVMVLSGSNIDASLTIVCRTSEKEGNPTGASGGGSTGGGPSNPILTGSSIATGQVNVLTTAGGTLIVAARIGRKSLNIENTDGTNYIAVGNTGLTLANGHIIRAGIASPFNTQGAVYGIASTATVAVSYWEDY